MIDDTIETVAETTEHGTKIVLPTGQVVHGVPQDTDDYRATAERLGYGDDLLAMCRDHDVLHCRLCAWLKIPTSYCMRDAAGILPEAERALADAEEEAVMAVQRFMRMHSNRKIKQ